jgi:hypothetical protein
MPTTITVTAPGPDFGEIPATRSVTCQVTVQNGETMAIRLSLADDSGKNLFRLVSAPAQIGPGRSATFGLAFQSDAVPTPSATITGALRAGTATATVTATVLSPIAIEEMSVDYGDTPVDAGVVSVVRVTNSHATADATLTVDGAEVFEVNPSDVGPSGVAQAVWVRFRPTEEGSAAATLTATVGTFSDTCSLSGNGILEALDELDAEDGGEPRQRFHVDVPNPHTYLGLGGSLGGQGHMALSMNGVGLETEEDIFVNGMGGESKLFAQATSNVVIQSVKESLYTSAKENNVQCAGDFSYVMGTKGVVIASGLPASYDSLSPLDGTHDTDKPHEWAMGFASTDAIVGTLLTILDMYHLKHEWKHLGGFGKAFGVLGRVATIAGATLSATGAPDIVPATTVLGLAGVVVATPAFVAMYGLAGIGMVSTYPSMVGVLDAAMLAGRDATISALGGAAALQGRVVEVRARREIALKAATLKGLKFAPIKLEGSQIEVKAHSAVISDSDLKENTKLTAGAGKVAIDAAKEVTIAAGKFLVKVAGDYVCIGMHLPNEPENIDPNKPMAMVDDKKVYLRGPGNTPLTAPLLMFDGTEATLGFGSKSNVRVTAAGITLKSAGVDLSANGRLKIKGGIIALG